MIATVPHDGFDIGRMNAAYVRLVAQSSDFIATSASRFESIRALSRQIASSHRI
jgi:hypothetical protein